MERVIAVFVYEKDKGDNREEKIEEFISLLEAANAEAVIIAEQAVERFNAATLIGSGKVKEIANLIEEHEIAAVCFNEELSGSQIKNLEKAFSCKVIDRTHVILDIFADRATEKEGRLQVKLAQLEYRLPRLVGYGEYLSRQGGGIGTRGPGEQKIDTDRRHILREIQSIKKELENSKNTRKIIGAKRRESSLPIIALVGYTNAGKSTIFNGLLDLANINEGKMVSAKDRLFETLGTSHRYVRLYSDTEVLLMDTVGFVSDLPTEFVEAFKSTLEEIVNCDLILHIIDGASKTYPLQVDITLKMLESLGAMNIPRISVINKTDMMDNIVHSFDPRLDDKIFISAKKEEDLIRLSEKIDNTLFPEGVTEWFIPFIHQNEYMAKFSDLPIKNAKYSEDGTYFTGYLRKGQKRRLEEWKRSKK